MAEAVLKHRGLQPEKVRELKIRAKEKGQSLSTAALLPSGRPAGMMDALACISTMGVSKESFAIVVERSTFLPDTATPSDLLVDLSNRRGWEEEIAAQQDAVTVATIHGAKGSEWDVVFLVGLEEDILPRIPKMVPAEMSDLALEEERRLCYVAITRAKHRLYLTWARNRATFGFGRPKPQLESRFVNEMYVA
jgi:superfamily I DNA/RNA helicase